MKNKNFEEERFKILSYTTVNVVKINDVFFFRQSNVSGTGKFRRKIEIKKIVHLDYEITDIKKNQPLTEGGDLIVGLYNKDRLLWEILISPDFSESNMTDILNQIAITYKPKKGIRK